MTTIQQISNRIHANKKFKLNQHRAQLNSDNISKEELKNLVNFFKTQGIKVSVRERKLITKSHYILTFTW